MIPKIIPNWINGKECLATTAGKFEKLNPANGKMLCQVTKSDQKDIKRAVEYSKKVQNKWADTPAVQRGEILHEIVLKMKQDQDMIAKIVSLETGKSIKDALGEVSGAMSLGLFYASEGQRLYGRTTTSGTQNKYAMTIRCPIGVAGLIIAANTPIANVAWKVFPALICGNTAILKAAEDTPATAWIFGKIAKAAGLPDGVLNIIQGYGEEAGAPLVAHEDVGIISFTGSTSVGQLIQKVAGDRFARVSLELGGKNPLIVCDDADLDNAVKWVLLSVFSNAGQRCSSASRIIIFNSIYKKFCGMLTDLTKQLKIGTLDEDDLGPVINEKQLNNMLKAIQVARKDGSKILIGGERMLDSEHESGFYMMPTLMENVDPHSFISETELFGPIGILYRVNGFNEAMDLANDSPYGLTACIHTTNFHRAIRFYEKIQTGVAVVNAGTYGSEPHMPFGGLKQSGNGTREPGTEALNIYSELKNVFLNIDQQKL
jgi:alpha-ketoglutaric semialdehyde dehydrogenase